MDKEEYYQMQDEIKQLKEELEWTKKEWNNSNPSKECRQKLEKIEKLFLNSTYLSQLVGMKKLEEILEGKA